MDEDDDAKMREVRRSNNNNNKKDYDIKRVPNKDLITKTLDQKPSATVMEWKGGILLLHRQDFSHF